MNMLEHLLFKAAEECAEVTQRLSKAARFGILEIQPTNPDAGTNQHRIEEEWKDLIVAMDRLGFSTDISAQEYAHRSDRIDHYLKYAKNIGTLEVK